MKTSASKIIKFLLNKLNFRKSANYLNKHTISIGFTTIFILAVLFYFLRPIYFDYQGNKKFFENKSNYKIIEKLSFMLNISDLKLNKDGKLLNNTFMFTGKLSNMSRAEAKSLIEENSGSVVSSVNKKLKYLIIGEKPTNRKVQQAKDLGIKILSQKEWLNLLN